MLLCVPALPPGAPLDVALGPVLMDDFERHAILEVVIEHHCVLTSLEMDALLRLHDRSWQRAHPLLWDLPEAAA